MQRLTQEGLLVPIRNRGLFVIDMTVDEIRDMYLAREAIERTAARRVVAGDYEAAGDELLAVVRKMSEAEGDPAAVGEIDIAFHELLVHLAASPRLTRIHKTLITETRMCIHALAATYSGAEARVDEHRLIAEAIRAGDHLQADDLLAAHMEDAIARLTSR